MNIRKRPAFRRIATCHRASLKGAGRGARRQRRETQVNEGTLQQAPRDVERFVRQLDVVTKAVGLYPTSSDIPRQAAERAVEMLASLSTVYSEVSLTVLKDVLCFGELPIAPTHPASEAFARKFYRRNLAEIRFHSGATADEIAGFLRLLSEDPDEIKSDGGMERRLWAMDISGITVKETQTVVVDSGAGLDEEDWKGDWPPTPAEVDELLVQAHNGRGRDRRTLLRLIEDPSLVHEYFQQGIAEIADGQETTELLNRLSSLARVAGGSPPPEQASMLRSLGQATLALEGDVRRALLQDKILPAARYDSGLANLLRHTQCDELCKSLVEGLTDTADSRASVVGSMQALVRLGTHDRHELLVAFESTLRSEAFSPDSVHKIMSSATPARVQVRPTPLSADAGTPSRVLSLLESGRANGTAVPIGQEESDAVREDVRRGVTDGDVLCSLATVASLETREDEFSAIISLLDDRVRLLIERQELEAARRVAGLLVAAHDDPARDEAQRFRLRRVIESMADHKAVRDLTRAMQLYPSESVEAQACWELLDTFGRNAITPVLEALADEEDLRARKTLMDLLCSVAGLWIQELGEWIDDERWYVVRNIVCIIAATKDPAALPYLERTLRHPEPRVRRETIRGLVHIGGQRCNGMLVMALRDADAQNVQLACRYLGAIGWKSALQPLLDVACAVGSASQELASRIEAIEAIGRIGGPECIDRLSQLKGQGILSLLRLRRDNRLRTAAEAAIQTIKARQRADSAVADAQPDFAAHRA